MNSLVIEFPAPPMNRYNIPLPLPGKAWREATVETYDAGEEFGVMINNLYITSDMFHMLSEYNDWSAIRRGDIEIIGRVDLELNMLDLVLMDDEGHPKAASIDLQSASCKPFLLRTYLYSIWRTLPLVLIHQSPYLRSYK